MKLKNERRAGAAEGRAEALKEERRRAPEASPALLKQHAAQVAALKKRLEHLQVMHHDGGSCLSDFARGMWFTCVSDHLWNHQWTY